MSVGVMMPHDSRGLPAISQRCSSTLQEGFRVASDRQSAAEMVGAVARFTSGPYSQRMDSSSSKKSSSGSDSRMFECSDHRSGQGAAQTYSGIEETSQLLVRDNILLNGGGTSSKRSQPVANGRNILPCIIGDHGLLKVPKSEKEQRPAFSSRSLEIFPSRDLISEELRMRAISLPSLGSRHKSDERLHPVVSNHEDGYRSYTDSSSDEEGNPIVEIDPFPNFGADSYLNSHLIPDFLPPYLKPWTPGIPKTRFKRIQRSEEAERKRKELEALVAKERRRKAQGKSRHNRRRFVRSDAFARKTESEAAKRHPVKKQFVYSELVEVELQKLTPKRIPGGKLKPIYNRRTEDGDIDIPREIHISLDNLSLKPSEDRIDFPDSPAEINKRRQQELHALLEKRKKLQHQIVHKKKRKVRFLLPDDEKRRHEVSARVNVAGGMYNETRCRSTSPDQRSNNDTEETLNEIAEQRESGRETTPKQSDIRIPEDIIKLDGIYDEGQEFITERANSWSANHTSSDPPETLPDTEVINDIPTPTNHILVLENAAKSQSRVFVTDTNSKSPLDPDISNGSASIPDLNSNFQPGGAPSNCQDTSSAGKQRHLSVENDAAQAAQLNPLPGRRPDSPLLDEDDGVFAANAPVTEEPGAVLREIKFLSERLPSIIISDT